MIINFSYTVLKRQKYEMNLALNNYDGLAIAANTLPLIRSPEHTLTIINNTKLTRCLIIVSYYLLQD